MRRRNVFWIGLNDFNREKLRATRHAAFCDFHGLLTPGEMLDAETFPVGDMLCRARDHLRSFPGTVDAVLGYMDFPVSTMLPILCREFDLPTSSLESVLRCEHKYWSRLEQRRAVPEHTPAFCAFDPFDDGSVADIALPYPFWVKPIKSAGSHLGFRIGGRADLRRAVERIREGIRRYGDPFDHIVERADVPEEVRRVRGRWCLAEEIVHGRQCTVEGWVLDGEYGTHGVVDSLRYPNRSSFLRYEYPSRLPARVRERMGEVAERFLRHVGYDRGAFNVELFWEPKTDRVRLLEANTRVAQHHSDLFEKVDGASNHEVALDVALGKRPDLPHRRGPFRRAATWWLRTPEDAVVRRVPTREEIRRLEEEIPGTEVEVEVSEGMRLSDLEDQDSYSYAYAIVYVGADDPEQLRRRFERCRESLPFRFEPATGERP
ncbi:MAG: ATP-grasp domain-containing protein [Myxococcota bacterium]